MCPMVSTLACDDCGPSPACCCFLFRHAHQHRVALAPSRLPQAVGRAVDLPAGQPGQLPGPAAHRRRRAGRQRVPGAWGGLVAAPTAIAADGVSYVVSVASLLLIRRPEVVEPRVTGSSLRQELAEGVRYVWRHPLLRPIALCTGIGNYFGHIAMAVLILYAVRSLGLSPGLIGLWFSVGSIGAPLGAMLAGRMARRFGAGHTIIATAVVYSLSWFFVPLAPQSFPLPFLIASGLFGSLASVMYNITQVSLRQAITPQRL